MSEPATGLRFRSLLLAPGLFVLALFLYGLQGQHTGLGRDDSIFVYSGQQLAQGVPPYVSTFHAKTPLSPLLCGLGAALAGPLGVEDLTAIRLLYLVLCALTVAAVHLLASQLFGSREAGLVAALVFVGFWGFGTHALGGPRAKAPMVLFETLALLLAARRSFASAAFCGALAFLVWQPTAVFAGVCILLAGLQSSQGRRLRSAVRATAAAAAPVLVVLAGFAAVGALDEMLDDTLVFNVQYLERQDSLSPLHAISLAISHGYARMWAPIVVGLLAICAMLPWRLARHGWSPGRFLRGDQFAALLLTFPAPVLWSLSDFQSYPDFYVFLPYAAVACGGLVHGALGALSRWGVPQQVRRGLLAGICVGLILSAGQQYRESRNFQLRQQQEWAQRIAELAGPGGSIVTIGVPQVLVFLQRTNPNPHVFICCGMERFIGERTPGGFDAWLDAIAAETPGAVVLESPQGPMARALAPRLPGYRPVRVGRWTAFVRER